MKHFKRNRSVFSIRMISLLDKYISRYIIFAFLACLLIGFCLLMFAGVELNKDIREQDRQQMELGVVWLNDQLDIMENIRDSISINRYFQPIYFSRNSIYELDIINQLSKYRAHSPLIEDIRLLYVQSPRYIYGVEHKTEYDVYLQKIMNIKQVKAFTDKLNAVEDYDIFTLEERRDLIFVAYRVKIMDSQNLDSEALLWFTVRKDNLLERVEYVSGLAQERIYQLLFHSIPLFGVPGEQEEPVVTQSEWMNVTQRDLTLIIYAHHITNSEPFLSLSLGGIVIIVLVLIILIFVAIYVGRRSYQPIGDLVNRFNLLPEDEFKQIENLMFSLYRSNELSQKRINQLLENLSTQKQYLKEYLILAMLNGEAMHVTPTQLESVGFCADHTLFCVALLHLQGAASKEGEIEEYIESAFDKNIRMLAVNVSHNLHFAIIISSDDAFDLLGMDEILMDMMNFKGLTAEINTGQIVHDFKEIHISFQTACQDLYQSSQTNLSVFLTGTLQDMLEKVDAGEEVQAQQILENMCRIIMKNYRVRNIQQGLFVQIGDQLNKLALSYGLKDSLQELHRLLLKGQDEQFIQMCHEMIRRISQVVQKQEKEKDNKNKEFFDSILQYIEENACDNQLSQKSVAEHFDISERQVSRLFLDFLHLNYKEYVIQIRVDRAQKLLRDGVSVADTALQVGYAHIPHFIKIFKERVGVTPGKYKDRLLADEPFEQ